MVDTGAVTTATTRTLPARVLGHFRQPLERSGYALLLASLLNSALGFAFWAVAARWYPAEAVGTATALIAAMTFLATLSTLGLRGGLLRFLPVAGARSGRMIGQVYTACAATAAVAATIFVAGSAVWASELSGLRDDPLVAAGFIAVVVVWVVYVLQEHVLAGLGRAVLVPLVALGYATVKLVLLALFIGTAGWGVFVAFTLPALFAVGAVSVVVFTRLSRRPESSVGDGAPSVGVLVRFAAGDHTATLLGLVAVDLVPLLVLAHEGASASAYYYVAFTAAYVLYLVTSNVASALVVEASRRPDRLAALTRRTLRNAGVIVALAVAVGVMAAEPLLGLLGQDYAANATTLMQLVLLSALPFVVVGVSAGVARVQRRTRVLVATNAGQAVMVFGGAAVGLRVAGLTGVGVAWVVGQTVLAVVLLLTNLRFAILGTGGPILAGAARVRAAVRRCFRSARARRLVPRVLATVGATSAPWSLLPGDNDTLVVATEVAGRSVVVKVALTERAATGVTSHADAVTALQGRDELGSWRRHLPEVLERGHLDGLPFTMESRLPGRSASSSLEGGVVDATAVVVAELHHLTGRAGSTEVVHRRIASTLEHLERLPGAAGRADALHRLGAALAASFPISGRIAVGWTHGDCWLGNVLVIDDPAVPGDVARPVAGIVDWENAAADGLPDVDLAHLWLGTRGSEIGTALRDALVAGPEQLDVWLDGIGVVRANPLVPAGVVLTIAWLQHVAGCAARTSPTSTWTVRNLDEVLPVALATVTDPLGDLDRTEVRAR